MRPPNDELAAPHLAAALRYKQRLPHVAANWDVYLRAREEGTRAIDAFRTAKYAAKPLYFAWDYVDGKSKIFRRSHSCWRAAEGTRLGVFSWRVEVLTGEDWDDRTDWLGHTTSKHSEAELEVHDPKGKYYRGPYLRITTEEERKYRERNGGWSRGPKERHTWRHTKSRHRTGPKYTVHSHDFETEGRGRWIGGGDGWELYFVPDRGEPFYEMVARKRKAGASRHAAYRWAYRECRDDALLYHDYQTHDLEAYGVAVQVKGPNSEEEESSWGFETYDIDRPPDSVELDQFAYERLHDALTSCLKQERDYQRRAKGDEWAMAVKYQGEPSHED